MMENKAKNLSEKLNMDQTNKQRYFMHYRDLNFYVRHGISVTDIYNVYKFRPILSLAK